MNYEVTLSTTIKRVYLIEAESEEEAIEIAKNNEDDYFSEETEEDEYVR